VTRYGVEITEEVLPLEAGLDDAISQTKGCYVGQEPVARVTARGHVNKKIVGLRCGGRRAYRARLPASVALGAGDGRTRGAGRLPGDGHRAAVRGLVSARLLQDQLAR
jgi:folate-binding protein YgfZ